MKKNSIALLTQGALIAALYVALTFAFSAISFGEVQVRVSEALTVLPAFTFSAVPGLFVGCLMGNLLSGAMPLDVIFGSLATLIGAFGTWALRGRHPLLAPVPPILANTLIVPYVLRYAYHIPTGIPLMMLTVGVGEILSCGVLGMTVYWALKSHAQRIFGQRPGKGAA